MIRIGDLTHDAVRWWELAGHDPEDLALAWAQSHHAVRLAALVGSAWGSPRGDSSHTSLTWMSGHGLLDGLFFAPDWAATFWTAYGLVALLRLPLSPDPPPSAA